MTTQEFSDAFDTLLNSYATQATFGEEASKADIVLDEYEKSVLLTQAQDLVIKSYFYRTLNNQGQGFDDSERRQVDFSSLIKVKTLTKSSDQTNVFDDRGIRFDLPKKLDSNNNEIANTTDVLFILNERLIVTTTDEDENTIIDNYVIIPLNYREYDREMSKAYSQPLKKQAWRLFQNTATGFDIQSELIPIWDIANGMKDTQSPLAATYKIRYVQRPNPIVLVDLPNGLTIDGFTTETQCTLNPILHVDILNKAVELALSTRGRISNSNQG